MKVLYVLLSVLAIIFLLGCEDNSQGDLKVDNPVNDQVDDVIDDKDDDQVDDKDNDQVDDKDDEKTGDDPIVNECTMQGTVHVGSTTTLTATELWSNAEICENLVMKDDYMVMEDISKAGTLVTSDFYIENFREMVPSWNVLVDNKSAVTFMISVGNEEGYSDFFTMGYWKENYKSSFSSQSDEYARVSIDTIVTKLDSVDRFKIKVIFKKTTTEGTFLKNISITTKKVNDVDDFNYDVLQDTFIDVAPRQQMSVPVIGSSICSPTSLSMLMNFYGYADSQDVVAGKVFDKGANIYGNWSFNASYAGGFSTLYSRVEYINNLTTIMEYLSQDIPMAFSIKTSSKDELVGSLMGYSAGHLVVLVGVKEVEGTWYGIVNDPAEYTDENVQREYKLSELLTAWRGYAYIVSSSQFTD